MPDAALRLTPSWYGMVLAWTQELEHLLRRLAQLQRHPDPNEIRVRGPQANRFPSRQVLDDLIEYAADELSRAIMAALFEDNIPHQERTARAKAFRQLPIAEKALWNLYWEFVNGKDDTSYESPATYLDHKKIHLDDAKHLCCPSGVPSKASWEDWHRLRGQPDLDGCVGLTP